MEINEIKTLINLTIYILNVWFIYLNWEFSIKSNSYCQLPRIILHMYLFIQATNYVIIYVSMCLVLALTALRTGSFNHI